MRSSTFSALSLFCTIVALSGIVRGEEVTRTLVAPAIGITSISVLGVEGDETTFALYQTADDGATTFVETMVADATNIVDVFPAPSFSCNFHETAKGKMQCIEADASSTAVISVAVQTLLYAVDDANTVAATRHAGLRLHLLNLRSPRVQVQLLEKVPSPLHRARQTPRVQIQLPEKLPSPLHQAHQSAQALLMRRRHHRPLLPRQLRVLFPHSWPRTTNGL
ncbi:hypothetical protein B0H17DRAFT_4862 [Mycena rosella]|uniref:Uncharacterized protein n=1 Tax=Mycena rosella TaxID=1033263 RepID=A0AAD7H2J6_MYCRO|nr:hypothetical protein B0H17DRAFT_4862 [Mycena rosella]